VKTLPQANKGMNEGSISTPRKKDSSINQAAANNRNVHEKYKPDHKIRFVTAASLFDGHDASINIMRRILQSTGAEVIHLGHNRSVQDIVNCAIQEDVQGIAISSYQGGHMEYFTYMIDLLKENGATHVQVFGGGGGVIVEDEIDELHQYGVSRIFSVADGSEMGLQGMINFMLKKCDFDPVKIQKPVPEKIRREETTELARAITCIENGYSDILSFNNNSLIYGENQVLYSESEARHKKIPLIGITGTGGAGKSSLTDEIVRRFLIEFQDLSIGIISIDPSKVKTGGALLGDRIRMNSINSDRVFMRSMATRAANKSVSEAVNGTILLYKAAGFDIIIVETSGIGQSGSDIVDICDIPIYVMTHEYGAATQLEKINMLDLAEIVVLNKFDKKGSLDALRDVRKQIQRNRGEWHLKTEQMPVFPTIASQFNDEGVNRLFRAIIDRVNDYYGLDLQTEIYTNSVPADELHTQAIIPGRRQRYLSEISETLYNYHAWADEQVEIASKLDQVQGTLSQLQNWKPDDREQVSKRLEEMKGYWTDKLDTISKSILEEWDELYKKYNQDVFKVKIRNKVIENKLFSESLSGTKIPRVALPKTKHAGERLRFALKENLPGYFPYTAGVFPFKREKEDPTRMFAGEGTPERTNKRFHYLSEGMPAARLSTAFDSVTLYGEDPGCKTGYIWKNW
jgi:isobutyryl-CoA mutase